MTPHYYTVQCKPRSYQGGTDMQITPEAFMSGDYDDRPYFVKAREWSINGLFYYLDFFLDGESISEREVRAIFSENQLFSLSELGIYEMTIHLGNGKVLETKRK